MREASVPGWGLERRHIYRQHDGFQPEAELNLGDDGKQDSPEDLKDAELRMLRELVKQYQLGGPESNCSCIVKTPLFPASASGPVTCVGSGMPLLGIVTTALLSDNYNNNTCKM